MVHKFTDLEFMTTPSEWPHGNKLPMVKRYTKAVGIMTWGGGDVEPKVVLVNLFGEITKSTLTLEYKSFSAILADGWRID